MTAEELREKAESTVDFRALFEESVVALERLQIQSDAFESEKEEAVTKAEKLAKEISSKQCLLNEWNRTIVDRDATIIAQAAGIRDLENKLKKKNRWFGIL